MVFQQDKLFTVQPDYHYEIFTGLSSDKTPMLGTKGIGDVFVLVYFDAEGKITHFEELPPLDVDFVVTNNPIENDRVYDIALDIALQKIGFASIEPISVKKFFIPKHLIGIRQYPDSMQRFLEDGPEYTAEEITALQLIQPQKNGYEYLVFAEKDLIAYPEARNREEREDFERWRDGGKFVLWSQNDFWCDSHGEITDS